MYSSYSKKYTGEIDEKFVLFLYPKGGSRWRRLMAFALRRQLSDSSRKRNGGANIRRKNRRYLAAGLTVFSLLFGGLQVWAAEEPDAGWETKIQKEEKSLSLIHI